MTAADVEARWSNYLTTPAGCWEWQGYIAKNGYGRVYDRNRPAGQRIQWVHRAFYERLSGPIPKRHELDHTCCNTICVNPDHLEVVTRTEHIRRTYERLGKDGLHRRAAELRILGLSYAQISESLGHIGKSGASDAVASAIRKGLVDADAIPAPLCLSPEEREDIRDLRSMGIPMYELAVWYGVDDSHISRICSRRDLKKGATA